MLISTHVLVGASIGRALTPRDGSPPGWRRLALAGASGIASHFACDALPHWGAGPGGLGVRDRAFLRVAVPDGLAGLALLAAVVRQADRPHRLLVATAALGACLPDADKVGEFAFGRSPYPRSVDAWHGRIQRESPKRLPRDVAFAIRLAAQMLIPR